MWVLDSLSRCKLKLTRVNSTDERNQKPGTKIFEKDKENISKY